MYIYVYIYTHKYVYISIYIYIYICIAICAFCAFGHGFLLNKPLADSLSFVLSNLSCPQPSGHPVLAQQYCSRHTNLSLITNMMSYVMYIHESHELGAWTVKPSY